MQIFALRDELGVDAADTLSLKFSALPLEVREAAIAKLRRLVPRASTPKRLESLEVRTNTLAAELVGKVCEQEEVDFVSGARGPEIHHLPAEAVADG